MLSVIGSEMNDEFLNSWIGLHNLQAIHSEQIRISKPEIGFYAENLESFNAVVHL